MNSRTAHNIFRDIYKNLWNNIRIIFLVGIFFGMLFAAYHIVINNIIYNDYQIVYKVELKAKAYYSNLTSTLTEEECTSILYGENVKNAMLEHFCSQEQYDKYMKNISLEINDDTITIYFTGESETEVRSVVSQVFSELCNELRDKDIVNEMEIQEDLAPKKIRQKVQEGINIGITYMIEIGIITGMLIAAIFFTVGYLIRGNVKDEIDVYKYFNLPVLSNIPPIDENVITQVPSQNDEY